MSGSWLQRGLGIAGVAYMGWSVTLNKGTDTVQAGTIIAMSSDNYAPNGFSEYQGQTRIYQWNGTSWSQKGNFIDGEGAWDGSGRSISLSADGTSIVIGAPANNNRAGRVAIYSYNEETNIWVKKGSNILGAAGSSMGDTVALSHDGNVVIIGARNAGPGELGEVSIYAWNSSNWVKRGNTISSNRSVTINSDGSVIGVGNPLFNSEQGKVQVYSWNGSSWIKRGSDINGEAVGDSSGYSISLSKDGNNIAIGAPGNDGNGSNSGHVRVYRWNGTSWIKIGNDIDARVAGDQGGFSVSLNDNGKIVAVGAITSDSGNTDNGVVTIYGFNELQSSWINIGEIAGTATSQLEGYSLDLSSDGSVVVAGTPYFNGDQGRMRVFYNSSPPSLNWIQQGLDIDGEAINDYSGYSVSLSADGSIVAIGAYGNDGNGSNSGHVRVYVWNGSSWQQRGSDIDGEILGDNSGFSVSLNANGAILAIGARYAETPSGMVTGHVRVYVWNSSSWEQRGSDIDGEAAGDWSGNSVSLNADGTVLAIGAPRNDENGSNSGHVRVYVWNGSSWQQRGSDINGEAANDESGYSVSLSADGSILAIGAWGNDGNGSNSGHVRVYVWNSSSWQQRGSDINGEASGNQSGWSVSLSADGTILAIGATLNNGNGSSSGHVRVYVWNNSSWQQRGSDIDGEIAGNQSGWSVSLSADGTILAIGAPYNNANGTYSGHVRVYKWNNSNWFKVGLDIDGETEFYQSGSSLSLSADGTIIAIGAPGYEGNDSHSGQVRVYKYSEPVPVYAPPAAPTINTATKGNASITITFTAGNDGGSAITGYKYSLNGGSYQSLGTTTSPATITGLTNGSSYTITLKATNAIGDSLASASVGPITLDPTLILNIASVGVNTSSVQTAVQSLTLSTGSPTLVNLQSIVNINSLATAQDKQTARQNIIEYIFQEKSSASTFRVNRTELGLTASKPLVTETLVLKKDTSGSSPIVIDTLVSSSKSIYAPLSEVGDKNTVTYNSKTFSFEKIGANQYRFTDASGSQSTYSTGSTVFYSGLLIEFGSVEITQAGATGNSNIPVVVNLDVLVDASGNISVFGQQAPVVSNVIVANTTLPVNALYDASGTSNSNVTNALFEFWEPSSAIGTRLATKCTTGSRDYTKMTKKFVRDLQAVLEGSFDCSQAIPFNSYGGNVNYTTQPDFGRLALSTYAHYLFGHIAATSAITNDQAFMNSILSRSSTDASGNPAYKYATAVDVSGNANGSQWTRANGLGTTSDADLSRLLVGAIVNKNDAAILTIVEQVLGQDTSRAMDQDNNQLSPDVHQPLKFIPGDIIYMNIKLVTPSVSVGSGQQVSNGTLEGKYPLESHQNYALKITLENKSGFAYAS